MTACFIAVVAIIIIIMVVVIVTAVRVVMVINVAVVVMVCAVSAVTMTTIVVVVHVVIWVFSVMVVIIMVFSVVPVAAVIVVMVRAVEGAGSVVQLLLQSADLPLKQLPQRAGVGDGCVPLLLADEKHKADVLITMSVYFHVLSVLLICNREGGCPWRCFGHKQAPVCHHRGSQSACVSFALLTFINNLLMSNAIVRYAVGLYVFLYLPLLFFLSGNPGFVLVCALITSLSREITIIAADVRTVDSQTNTRTYTLSHTLCRS